MEEKRGSGNLEDIAEDEKTPARCRSVEPPEFQRIFQRGKYRMLYCSENMKRCNCAIKEMLAVPIEGEHRLKYYFVCKAPRKNRI